MITAVWLFSAQAGLPEPPAPPSPPALAVPATLPSFDKPLPLPAAGRSDRFALSGSGILPSVVGTRVAVVVPETLNANACGSRCPTNVRTALLRAMLDLEAVPFDFGTLGLVTKNPDSDLPLRDASSLWATRINTADAPTDLVVHVLSFDVVVTELPAGKALEYTPDQRSIFNAYADSWNEELQSWNKKRDEVVAEHRTWTTAWDTYEQRHAQWASTHRRALRRHRMASTGAARPSIVAVPEPPLPASMATLQHHISSHRGVVRRMTGSVTFEVLDARTGTVKWVGSIRGETADGVHAVTDLTRQMFTTAWSQPPKP